VTVFAFCAGFAFLATSNGNLTQVPWVVLCTFTLLEASLSDNTTADSKLHGNEQRLWSSVRWQWLALPVLSFSCSKTSPPPPPPPPTNTRSRERERERRERRERRRQRSYNINNDTSPAAPSFRQPHSSICWSFYFNSQQQHRSLNAQHHLPSFKSTQNWCWNAWNCTLWCAACHCWQGTTTLWQNTYALTSNFAGARFSIITTHVQMFRDKC